MYYAGIFSAFSHRTTWTLVYYAGIFSVFSYHTNWTLVYYAGIFSVFSHRSNWMLVCSAGIFSVFSHHTNWTYARKRCLVFVAVDIEVYFAVYFNCISMFQSAKLLSRVWLVQTLDIDVPLKCM